MAKKKIFIIAPDFYGIDKSICNAFKSLGFDVVLKNTRPKLNLIEAISLKMSNKLSITKNILNHRIRYYLNKDNKEYINLIKENKPDMLFIIKGETIFPDTLKLIRNEIKIPCIAYIWDCPFYSYAGQFADDYRKNNFAEGMHLYDYVFVYDPYYVEEIKKRGITNVDYLPLATDPDKYRRIDLSQTDNHTYGFDVSFVGSPLRNRIEILENLSEFKLGVFGDGWEDFYRFKRIPTYFKGKTTKEKVLKIYNASKIVLNIHDPEAKYGVNTRTFDILACGAFELVDYKPELKKLFKAGNEIIYYRNITELKELIIFYLKNERERQRIVEKGRDRVLGWHTWHHRMKRVINVLHNRGLVA